MEKEEEEEMWDERSMARENGLRGAREENKIEGRSQERERQRKRGKERETERKREIQSGREI